MMGQLSYLHLIQRSAMVTVNCYIVFDPDTAQTLVIDPGGEPERLCRVLHEHGLTLKYIVLTHGHFDNIMCTAELKRCTGAVVCMNQKDEFFIRDSEYNAVNYSRVDPIEPFEVERYLYDGDIIDLGDKRVKVIATPGHTPGGISLYIPGSLFCGDAVLRGTTGRMDLAGADLQLLIDSISKKIFTLPEDTVIHCGHHECTTVICMSSVIMILCAKNRKGN